MRIASSTLVRAAARRSRSTGTRGRSRCLLVVRRPGPPTLARPVHPRAPRPPQVGGTYSAGGCATYVRSSGGSEYVVRRIRRDRRCSEGFEAFPDVLEGAPDARSRLRRSPRRRARHRRPRPGAAGPRWPPATRRPGTRRCGATRACCARPRAWSCAATPTSTRRCSAPGCCCSATPPGSTTRGALPGWLSTTARREALAILRAQQRAVPTEDVADQVAPDDRDMAADLIDQELRARPGPRREHPAGDASGGSCGPCCASRSPTTRSAASWASRGAASARCGAARCGPCGRSSSRACASR